MPDCPFPKDEKPNAEILQKRWRYPLKIEKKSPIIFFHDHFFKISSWMPVPVIARPFAKKSNAHYARCLIIIKRANARLSFAWFLSNAHCTLPDNLCPPVGNTKISLFLHVEDFRAFVYCNILRTSGENKAKIINYHPYFLDFRLTGWATLTKRWISMCIPGTDSGSVRFFMFVGFVARFLRSSSFLRKFFKFEFRLWETNSSSGNSKFESSIIEQNFQA